MDGFDDWERLADSVIARRTELGMTTRQELARKTGLSYRLLGDLERGTRPVSEGSLAILEQVLGWQPGSAKKILEGGDPRPAAEGVASATVAGSPMQVADVAPQADRALDEAFRLASTIIRSGDDSAVTRLGEFLGDFGHSLMVSANSQSDYEPPRESDWKLTIPRARPTVLRIALGEFLRDQRVHLGMSIEEVSEQLGCEEAVLQKVEGGVARFGRKSIRRALTSYGVRDPRIHREFGELADTADRSGWWTNYSDVLPEWFEPYMELEQRAQMIRTFESHYIPGLLQTPEYARAVIRQMLSSNIERRVSVRMHRQQVLVRSGGLKLWAIIDEAAFYRSPEGADMREQIAHLIEIGERDNVVIQVLPTSRYPSSNPGSFSLMRMSQYDSPDLVYVEELTSVLYMDRPHEIDQYTRLLDRIGTFALTPEATAKYLRDLLDSLGDSSVVEVEYRRSASA
jgi:transcriptional regulator with XRE-family HTH domain